MKYAKMYAALVGSICTALLGVYAADTTVGQVLTVGSVVATAVGTWAIPNQPADERGAVGVSGAIAFLLAIFLILGILWLLGVHVRVG